MHLTRQKKQIIFIFVALCILAFASYLMILVLEKGEVKSSGLGTNFEYYDPDYEFDIYSDAEYLELDRNLSYTDGAVTFTYSLDDDLSLIDPALGFFASYLKCIINGDFDSYPSFFDDEYPNIDSLPKKFTMQMLYNISLEKLPGTAENGDSIYRLDYLIRKNNGTFRPEIGSDGCKSQYITLTKNGDSYLIDGIYTVNIKTEVIS